MRPSLRPFPRGRLWLGAWGDVNGWGAGGLWAAGRKSREGNGPRAETGSEGQPWPKSALAILLTDLFLDRRELFWFSILEMNQDIQKLRFLICLVYTVLRPGLTLPRHISFLFVDRVANLTPRRLLLGQGWQGHGMAGGGGRLDAWAAFSGPHRGALSAKSPSLTI